MEHVQPTEDRPDGTKKRRLVLKVSDSIFDQFEVSILEAEKTSDENDSIGDKCVVCHSDESNEACNARAESCDRAGNQVCQTVVRVENGLAPRFEKRCKQKQACKNQRAIYKKTGICQGGTR